MAFLLDLGFAKTCAYSIKQLVADSVRWLGSPAGQGSSFSGEGRLGLRVRVPIRSKQGCRCFVVPWQLKFEDSRYTIGFN